DAATGVQVTDVLPSGLTLVSATPSQGTYAPATGLWTVGSVANGAEGTLTFLARVVNPAAQPKPPPAPHADPFSPNHANHTPSTTATPQQADLAVIKTVSDTAPIVGETITFTVTLANKGPDTATNVAVEDLLPVGLTLVSATPSQGTYNPTTGLWTAGT